VHFEFIASQLPFGYAYNFENYLFNKVMHINTQGTEDRVDFFLANHAKKRIEAKVHFLLKDGEACSPYKSLFGSYELNARLSTDLLSGFVDFIEDKLASRGVRCIRIVHHATAYNHLKSDKVRDALTSRGYAITWTGINHHIAVDSSALTDRVHPMEARRLRKCAQAGLQCVQETVSSADQIHAFIGECRREQKLKPSIPLSMLKFYLERFPLDYMLFAVRNVEGTLYAATVAIRVCRRILYNFLPASPSKFRTFSPTVLLIEGLYKYCQAHSYEMLDFGVSTLPDGRHQQSLIAFKEHMGGQPSEKWIFEKAM
jgi:hypothetical protein